MDDEETSKEMMDIINAIDKYIEKHQGEVCIHASFLAYKKDGNGVSITDDRILAYGPKKTVQISISGIKEELDKDPNEFINW